MARFLRLATAARCYINELGSCGSKAHSTKRTWGMPAVLSHNLLTSRPFARPATPNAAPGQLAHRERCAAKHRRCLCAHADGDSLGLPRNDAASSPAHGFVAASTPGLERSSQLALLERRVADAPLNALESRAALRAELPAELFRVAGVSFQGRQERIAALQPEQALALVKEPDNEVDPNAIRVQTLGGAELGYVPRELTHRFPHDTTFAHVYNIGLAAEASLYGAQVMVRPSLPLLALDALPAALAPHASLAAALPPADWERLCRSACRAATYRCEVSRGAGAPPGPPLECHERWVFDDGAGVARLAGIQALCPEVHAAKHLLAQPDERRRQEALWTLQAMNEWTVMEAEDYLGYVRSLAAERSAREWRVDVSWLEGEGVAVPAALQAMRQ